MISVINKLQKYRDYTASRTREVRIWGENYENRGFAKTIRGYVN